MRLVGQARNSENKKFGILSKAKRSYKMTETDEDKNLVYQEDNVVEPTLDTQLSMMQEPQSEAAPDMKVLAVDTGDIIGEDSANQAMYEVSDAQVKISDQEENSEDFLADLSVSDLLQHDGSTSESSTIKSDIPLEESGSKLEYKQESVCSPALEVDSLIDIDSNSESSEVVSADDNIEESTDDTSDISKDSLENTDIENKNVFDENDDHSDTLGNSDISDSESLNIVPNLDSFDSFDNSYEEMSQDFDNLLAEAMDSDISELDVGDTPEDIVQECNMPAVEATVEGGVEPSSADRILDEVYSESTLSEPSMPPAEEDSGVQISNEGTSDVVMDDTGSITDDTSSESIQDENKTQFNVVDQSNEELPEVSGETTNEEVQSQVEGSAEETNIANAETADTPEGTLLSDPIAESDPSSSSSDTSGSVLADIPSSEEMQEAESVSDTSEIETDSVANNTSESDFLEETEQSVISEDAKEMQSVEQEDDSQPIESVEKLSSKTEDLVEHERHRENISLPKLELLGVTPENTDITASEESLSATEPSAESQSMELLNTPDMQDSDEIVEETYNPNQWKEPIEEDQEVVPEEPEGFEEPLPEETDEEPGLKKKKKQVTRKRHNRAKVVDDDDLPEDPPVVEEAKKEKQKTSIKDLILSLTETAIAAAVFLVVGYQIGGVVLNRLLQSVLGG